MSSAPFSPNIDIVETMDGVRYVLHTSNSQTSNLALGLALVVRVPVVAAGLAVWFLWQHFRQVSVLLAGLSGLFVAQMLFVARMPWNLFRQTLWQQLVARFGHGEIELCGERLFLGNRVGVFWSGEQRELSVFQRVAVYVYQDAAASVPEHEASAGASPVPTERAVLAIDTCVKSPWLLVDGFSRSETITLANDLHRRIAAVSERFSPAKFVPPPVVIETQERALYPPLSPDFYRRKKPWWLLIHLAGTIGLGALTVIGSQVGAWQFSSTKAALILGWFLEFLILGTTISLRGDASLPDLGDDITDQQSQPSTAESYRGEDGGDAQYLRANNRDMSEGES